MPAALSNPKPPTKSSARVSGAFSGVEISVNESSVTGRPSFPLKTTTSTSTSSPTNTASTISASRGARGRISAASATHRVAVAVPTATKMSNGNGEASVAMEESSDELSELEEDELEEDSGEEVEGSLAVPTKKPTKAPGSKKPSASRSKSKQQATADPTKPTKKRKAPDSAPTTKPSKKLSKSVGSGHAKIAKDDAAEVGSDPANPDNVYRCHQCRGTFVDREDSLVRCTEIKQRKFSRTEREAWKAQKGEAPGDDDRISERCRHKFCNKCLKYRYGEDFDEIRPEGDSEHGYQWKCPVCAGDCNCSACRKRLGLAPTGYLNCTAVGYSSVRELLAKDPENKSGDLSAALRRRSVENLKPNKSQKPAKDGVAKSKATRVAKKSDKQPKAKKKKINKKPSEDIENGSDSSDLSDVSSSDLSDIVPSNEEALKATLKVAPKVVPRRAPRTVLAPKLVYPLATAGLSSAQILARLNIREFIVRFRQLIPGFGFGKDGNKSDVQRGEKILESMDDVINFWNEDEGGMRTVLSGLVGALQMQKGVLADGEPLIHGEDADDILGQIRKESKTGITAAHNTAGAIQCWETTHQMLREQGFGENLADSVEEAYLPSDPETEERRARSKVRPEDKVAIINLLIEFALRTDVIRDDLAIGLEREKDTRMEIVKNRAKVNKDWIETKASLLAEKPLVDSLLDADKPPSKQGVKVKAAEEERVVALQEWEDNMREKERQHKEQIRLFGIAQHLAGTNNRLRFQPIGTDTRGNTYYVLSETPGRAYPEHRGDLAWAWSYNLIINGAPPNDENIPKTARDGQAKAARASSTPSAASDFDMLEGGEREDRDQWLRISEPHEIRQIADWIRYEALLLDRKAEGGASVETDGDESMTGETASGKVKEMAGLVEQCLAFAEHLSLRVEESEMGERGAAREQRAEAPAGLLART